MKLSLRNFLNLKRVKINLTFVFFALFYLYLLLQVKPNLIYHGGGQLTNFPVFYTGWTFFLKTACHPGGLIEYLSAFLSQFLYFSWTGAIVLTIHALLFCLFTRYFLKKIQIGGYNIISFIPAVLLLVTYNSYTYHFTITLALLTALIISCLFVLVEPKNKIFSILLFLFLSATLYLIAAGASLFFILLCTCMSVSSDADG